MNLVKSLCVVGFAFAAFSASTTRWGHSPLNDYLPTDSSKPADGLVIKARTFKPLAPGDYHFTPGDRMDIHYKNQEDHAFALDEAAPRLYVYGLRWIRCDVPGGTAVCSVNYRKCSTCSTYCINDVCGFSVTAAEEDGEYPPFYIEER